MLRRASSGIISPSLNNTLKLKSSPLRFNSILASSSSTTSSSIIRASPRPFKFSRPIHKSAFVAASKSSTPASSSSSSSSSSKSSSIESTPLYKVNVEGGVTLLEDGTFRAPDGQIWKSMPLPNYIYREPIPEANPYERTLAIHHHGTPIEEFREDIGTWTTIFKGVPKLELQLGLAGGIPYFLTTAATGYFSWVASQASSGSPLSPNNQLFIQSPLNVDAEFALKALEFLQPIQIGYGVCILSFLGAIHWGLEFAQFGGRQGLKRYALGILPPMLAWPTILMPTEAALITQFLGFTGMWFADSNATRYGWAPGWYNAYRFVLTFIVCTSILGTLVIKGWLGDPTQQTGGAIERLARQKAQGWRNLERAQYIREHPEARTEIELIAAGEKPLFADDEEENEEEPKEEEGEGEEEE